MSLSLEAVRSRPIGWWLMGDTSPFEEYSGYNRSGTASGTTRSAALVSGAEYSTVFSNTAQGEFESAVFQKGKERQPFSLEATFLRIASDASAPVPQQVLGNDGQMDGLIVEGTKVSFLTKHGATAVTASYDIGEEQVVTAVGTHTLEKNSLYVNGVLVAEAEIPENLRTTEFPDSDGTLNSGASAGTHKVAVNGIGIYGHILSNEEVLKHYQVSTRMTNHLGVPAIFGGDRINVGKDYNNIFLETVWDSQERWNAGVSRGAVVSDIIQPSMNGTVSVASEWLDSFDVDFGPHTSVYGVNVDWIGRGARVYVSLADTWTEVQPGRKVPIIPVGFDPTDKALQIRVSFAGGIENDDSYVSRLTVTGVTNNEQVSELRVINFGTPAMPLREASVAQRPARWGALVDGGTLTIDNSTEPDYAGTQTIGLWVKQHGAAGLATSLTGTGYVNGSPGSTIPRGEWVLVHIVAAAPTASDITISGDITVGHVEVYDRALTAAEISAIYRSHVGMPILRVGDNSVIALAESTTPTQIYVHDWTIESAG